MADPADNSSGTKPSGKRKKGKLAQDDEPGEAQPPQYDPMASPGTLVADNETWVPDFLGDLLHIRVNVESLVKSILSPTFHYVVTTSGEKHLGSIHETDYTVGRLLSGGSRSFTADISDTNGRKILKPHEPIRLLGKVKKNHTGIQRRYTVSIALVNDMFGELFKLEAPVSRAWIFGAQDGLGRERAVVARRRTYLGDIGDNRTRLAVFNAADAADRFDLHFVGRPEKQAPQEPVRPLERALLLSSTILIDSANEARSELRNGSGFAWQPDLIGALCERHVDSSPRVRHVVNMCPTRTLDSPLLRTKMKLGRWATRNSTQPAPSNTYESRKVPPKAAISEEEQSNAGIAQGKVVEAKKSADQPPPLYDSIGPPRTLIAEHETLIPDFLGGMLGLHVDSDPRIYVITTPQNMLVGSIGESEMKFRSMVFGYARSFSGDIYDAVGRKILKVDRRMKFSASEMYVYAYPRDPQEPICMLGKVEKNFGIFHHRYIVSIALGNNRFGDLFQLEAGVLRGWTFSVQDGSGNECAVVARRPDESVRAPWLPP